MSRRVLRTGSVVLLTFFICVTLVHASSWQVGMIVLSATQNPDSDIGNRLYERFTAEFTSKVLTTNESLAITDRLEQTSLVDSERVVYESTKKNDGVVTPLQRPNPQDYGIGDEVPIVWSIVPIPELLKQSIAEGDGIVLEHIAHMHALDQILVVSIIDMDRFIRLVIQAFTTHTGVIRSVYDRIAQPQDISQMLQDALVFNASIFYGEPVGAILLKSSVLGVTAMLNGTMPAVVEDILFIKPGLYRVEATANGHETFSREIMVEQDKLISVNLSLTKMVSSAFLVQSPEGKASFTMLPDSMTTLPHLFLQQELPVLFRAEKEGFLPIDGQISNKQSVLELRFTPEWMTMENTLSRQKDMFYASLGRTLLLVGLSVGMESFSRAASTTFDRAAWQPAVLASAGLMGVSLTDTLFRLFAYYQKTQYISR